MEKRDKINSPENDNRDFLVVKVKYFNYILIELEKKHGISKIVYKKEES